jgi:hypothetical protein
LSLSPEQRSTRASIAALTRWGGEDPRPAMAKVREGRMRKYRLRVDPEGVLPEGERERRAQALLRADMRRLALKSSRARAAKAAP